MPSVVVISLLISGNRRRSNGYQMFSRRKAVGALRSNEFREQSSLLPVKMFHSTAASRIEISDEADEYNDLEDFTDRPSTTRSNNLSGDLGTMVRNRQGGRKQGSQLSTRAHQMAVTGQRSLPALLLTEQIVRLSREYRRLESAFSAMTPLDELVSEYLSIKYDWLEHQLETTTKSIRESEFEYSRIKDAQLQRIEDRLSTVIESLSDCANTIYKAERTLKLSRLESNISALALSVYELVEDVDEFVRPYISAKKNVDKILEESDFLKEDYDNLRRLFRMSESNLILIHLDLENLKNDTRYFTPAIREIFNQHYLAISRMMSVAMAISHSFRAYHLLRKLSEGPFGRAWYPYILRTYAVKKSPRDMKSKARHASILALISPQKDSHNPPHAATVLPRTYAKILQRFYLRRLGKPRASRSPRLHIYWRQLDVLAPFELAFRSSAVLSKQLMDLAKSLSSANSEMWSNLRNDARVRLREKTKRLFRRFGEHRFDILAEYQSLVHINWLRLETENKLYALGWKRSHSGPFTPRRSLSQDIGAFLRWTHKMAANEHNISLLSDRDKRNTISRRARESILQEERQIASEIILDYEPDTSPYSPSGRAATRMRSRKVKDPPSKPALRKVKTKSVQKAAPKDGPDRRKKLDGGKSNPKLSSLSRRDQRQKPIQAKKRDAARAGNQRVSLPPREHDNNRKSKPPRRDSSRPPPKNRSNYDSRLRRGKKLVDFGIFSYSKRSYTSGPAIIHTGTTESEECGSALVSIPNISLEPVVAIDGERCGHGSTALSGVKFIDTRNNSESSHVSEDHVHTPRFWSHHLCKGPGGKNILVHYCKSLQRTEEVTRYFLDSPVVGFDIEWKAQASLSDSIQSNVSLIQLANEERIALFQIALFRPGKKLEDLVAPSLKKLLESSDIMKVGVSIKADCTRLRKFLGINAHGLLELSHLYKLVKYSQSDPKMINKRLVNLNLQVEEHLGLPMDKDDDVRRSDWTRALDYRQVQCKFEGFLAPTSD